GDGHPYPGVAGAVGAGLAGIEEEVEPEEPFEGNAYASGAETVPRTLRDALALFEDSKLACEAFGEDVVAHYANNARVELAAFDAAVTDWELIRGFERL